MFSIKDPKAKAASTLQRSEALSTERVVGVLYGTKGLLGEGIGQRVGASRVGGAEQVVKGEVLGEDCVPPQHSNSE